MININQQPLKISLFPFLLQHFNHIQLQLPHFLPLHFTEIGLLHHKLHLCISEHRATTYLHSHSFAQFWDGTGDLAMVACASRFGTALK
jgi:hypothetical protein